MGNLYRFVEPILLFLLKRKGQAYGYELAGEMLPYVLTDAEVERAALYRTLRNLERNGNVTSEWMTERRGPARRIYRITPKGEQHLTEWITVLSHMAKRMAQLTREARELQASCPPRTGAADRRPLASGPVQRPVMARAGRGGTRTPGRGTGS
jgi:DNA-binding PadR family transcriptional regulator